MLPSPVARKKQLRVAAEGLCHFFTLLNLEVVGGCHFWLMDFVSTHFDTKH